MVMYLSKLVIVKERFLRVKFPDLETYHESLKKIFLKNTCFCKCYKEKERGRKQCCICWFAPRVAIFCALSNHCQRAGLEVAQSVHKITHL